MSGKTDDTIRHVRVKLTHQWWIICCSRSNHLLWLKTQLWEGTRSFQTKWVSAWTVSSFRHLYPISRRAGNRVAVPPIHSQSGAASKPINSHLKRSTNSAHPIKPLDVSSLTDCRREVCDISVDNGWLLWCRNRLTPDIFKRAEQTGLFSVGGTSIWDTSAYVRQALDRFCFRDFRVCVNHVIKD